MSTSRKLKVFVSSASDELKDERAIAREVIETKFKFTPIMFEDWGANTDAMRSTYRQEVANSDILVLILGRKYSTPTEEEFLLADELDKDILVYIRKDDANKREPRLCRLVDKIRDPEKGYIYYDFDTIIDLRERLHDNISKLVSTRAKRKIRSLNFETLLITCERQVKAELQHLKGSSEERGKKYIPDLYVRRVEIETEFEEFLNQQDKNACVIVGEAGIGKTNLLCHLSEILSRNRPALFINSLYITQTLEEYVLDLFRKKLGSRITFDQLMSEISRILNEEDLDLIIFLDAINESPNPAKLKKDLANFVHSNIGNKVKLYISCRDIDWEFFLGNNDRFLDHLYSKKGRVFLKKDIKFDEFTEREFKEAWRLYKRMYALKGELSKRLKQICKHPLMLRFLAEGFEEQHLPMDIRRIEIFDQYWFRKLEHTGKQDRGTEYMFAIVHQLKRKKTSELPKTEVVELLGDTTENLQTILSKILSENLITYLNWAGDRVVGFAYEAFLEYVMARWVIYGKPYRWLHKSNEDLMLEFRDFVEEAKGYRTMKGTIQYLVMMLEGTKRGIQINMLQELSKTKDPAWQSFVINVAYKLKNPAKIVHIIGKLTKQGELRRFAIRAIGDVGGDAALNYLANALEDKEEEIWSESITSLLKIADKKALTILVNALADHTNLVLAHEIAKGLSKKSKNPYLITIISNMLPKADVYTKRYVVEIVSEFKNQKAIEILLNVIKEDHELTRTIAIEALGNIVSDGKSLKQVEMEKIVDILMELLKHEDNSVKISAAKSLGAIGCDKAVEPLLKLLSEGDREVRTGVVEALGMIGGMDIFDHLAKILRSEMHSLPIRKRVIASLGLIGSHKAITVLVEALDREEYRGKKYIIGALRAIDPDRCLPVLVKTLQKDHLDPASIVETIGALKSSSAIEPLVEYLWKNPGKCDKAIVSAIGNIGGPQARETLLEILKKGDSRLKFDTIGALGQMKDKKCVRHLISYLKGSDTKLCEQSIIALGEIGDPKSVEALVETLRRAQSSSMRSNIAVALGLIDGDRVIDPLVVLLNDKDGNVREMAANSLGLTGSGRAVTPLLKSLADIQCMQTEKGARLSVIRALGKIENMRAVLPLINVLQTEIKKSKDVDIIREVVIALGNIKSTRANQILIEILETYKAPPDDVYSSWSHWSEYRLEIIEALIKIGDAIATDALMRFLRKPMDIYSGRNAYDRNRFERRLRKVAREGLMKILRREIRT